VGRGEGCDIGLFGDSDIEKLHARIVLRASNAEARLARLIELRRLARQGLGSPEERTELERLEGEQANA
jgi:hypothetical protein